MPPKKMGSSNIYSVLVLTPPSRAASHLVRMANAHARQGGNGAKTTHAPSMAFTPKTCPVVIKVRLFGSGRGRGGGVTPNCKPRIQI